MSSAPPSRVLINHEFAEDRHLPSLGEIIIVPLSHDLFGPGSIISNRDQCNYHHAVVLNISIQMFEAALTFTVLPIPAYSATDPTSGLSSTSWLLSQAVDFQQQHIPVPYEQSPPLTQLQPPLSTPAPFGDPLEVGGWKNTKPSWVLAVPQVTHLKHTTTFKCFVPPVKLNEHELRRLRTYSGLSPSLVVLSSSTKSPFPPESGGSTFGGPDTLSSWNNIVPGGSYTHQHNERDNHTGACLPAGSSPAFQALYANDAVKQAFASLVRPSIVLDSDSDSDSDDANDDWEDRMDPITFARYYAASSPHLAKIVQEHDREMHARLDQEITNWTEGVQSATFEGEAS